MLQKCTILGLVLLLAGGAAFAWLYRERQDEQRQAQSLAPANTLGSQEYIEKYGRWYQLSPEQQNQLVLEINEERKSKTAQQLGREQQARLRADLDKLAREFKRLAPEDGNLIDTLVKDARKCAPLEPPLRVLPTACS